VRSAERNARHTTDEAAQTHCAACDDVGWFSAGVPYGHPDFGTLIPCVCTETRRAKQRQAQLAQLSNLDRFRDKTFASFNQFTSGMQLAYQRALAYATHPNGWLAFFGPCGCGKTHLAAAIAHTVLARGDAVLFVVVPDLLDHLRATFSPRSDVAYDQRFEHVRAVDLLVLDDLGTESATPWACEKLYQLINYRYNGQLPTVFTSNVRTEQLDPRIVSRMHDVALPAGVLTLQAADYRCRDR
jgi:DNA replication protein DnaC